MLHPKGESLGKHKHLLLRGRPYVEKTDVPNTILHARQIVMNNLCPSADTDKSIKKMWNAIKWLNAYLEFTRP